MPTTDGEFDFLNGTVERRAGPGVWEEMQRLNLTDMLIGKEKEQVFRLLPGEERLDELTIRHRHLFIVHRGVTRVTLTTQRVLCAKTRVFSPVYWLLVVLFPPLIWYYAVRISWNRNVSMPLSSVDSVEKSYRPNWLLFLLAILAGSVLVGLCTFALLTAFGQPDQHAIRAESLGLGMIIRYVLGGLVAPGLLVLLLATRMVAIEVLSDNNKFAVHFSPTDLGVSESKFDAFIEKLYAQVQLARTSAAQAQASET